MESPTPFVRSPLPFPLSHTAAAHSEAAPSPPCTPFAHRPHNGTGDAPAAAASFSTATSLTRRRGEWFRNLFDLLQKAVALLLCCIFISLKHASSPPKPDSNSHSNASSTASSPQHSSFRRNASEASSAAGSTDTGSNARRVPPIGMGSLDQTRLQQPHQVTFYEILLVSSSASAADIKQSYRRLAIRYHPDRQHRIAAHRIPDKYAVALSADAKAKPAHQQQARLSQAQAQAIFIQIQAAYECLSNPLERQRYDYALRTKTRYKKLAGPAPSHDEDEADPASPSPAPSTMSSAASSYSTAYSTAQSTASSTRRSSFFAAGEDHTNFSSTASSTARSSRRSSLSGAPTRTMLLLPLALFDVFVLRPLRRRMPAPLLRLPSLLPRARMPRVRIPSPLGVLRRLTAMMALGVYLSMWVPLRCLLLANALRRWINASILSGSSGSGQTPVASKAPSPLQPRRKMSPDVSTPSRPASAFNPHPPASEPRDFPSFVRVTQSDEASFTSAAAACAAAAADTTSSESSPSLSTSPSMASAAGSMESMLDESALRQRQPSAKGSFLAPGSVALVTGVCSSTLQLHSLSDAECEGSDEGDGEEWSNLSARPSSSGLAAAHAARDGSSQMAHSASMPSLAQSESNSRSHTDGW